MASSTRSTRCTTVAGAACASAPPSKQSGENDVQPPVPRLIQAPIRSPPADNCSKIAATAAISPLRKAAHWRVPLRSSHRRNPAMPRRSHRGGDARIRRRRTATPSNCAATFSRVACDACMAVRPNRKSHDHAQARAILLIFRQRVRLLVAHHLQRILGLAQHKIRFGQLRDIGGRDELRVPPAAAAPASSAASAGADRCRRAPAAWIAR